jgi:hypothetical protein
MFGSFRHNFAYQRAAWRKGKELVNYKRERKGGRLSAIDWLSSAQYFKREGRKRWKSRKKGGRERTGKQIQLTKRILDQLSPALRHFTWRRIES